MSNGIETVSVAEASPAEVPAGPPADPSEKRLRWLELSLVVLVCFGNSIIGSIGILGNGPGSVSSPQNLRWTANIVHEVAGLLLVGYILARRKIRFASLGLRWSFRDLGMGFGIAVAAYLAYAAGFELVNFVNHAMYLPALNRNAAREIFGHPSILAIPFTFLNPFFEELIVRAYLMTEVKDLTGSWTLAAVLSVVVQFSYHLYYGWGLAIALSFQFVVFSIYYARTQKATPIIVAHGIFDIWALIRLFAK